jgi:cell division protein ZapA
MGQVSVSINERTYDINCDDGQEEHVAHLAELLNARVKALAATVGQVGESRLLLMAGLLVADELVDARAALAGAGGGSSGGLDEDATLKDIAALIDGLADQVEGIADRLRAS